jgi:hypothetical protein
LFTFSEVEDVIVIEKICDVELVAFIAVIVYVRTDAGVVGVPEIRPVVVLKDRPGELEIAGEIE